MRNDSGFAMLEALISLLIIMMGVLGIAGMQMVAINNTENARYQSIATILASSMAAEMQANTAYWATPPTTVTVNGATVSGVPAFAGTCLNSACTAPQMAYYDLQNWGTAMAGVANADGVVNKGMALPSGTGTVQCSIVSVPAVCSLTLTWSEKNIALYNRTGAESGVMATGTVNSNYTYQTLVSIQL
jgi:type IV pilus assembly protein PilV